MLLNFERKTFTLKLNGYTEKSLTFFFTCSDSCWIELSAAAPSAIPETPLVRMGIWETVGELRILEGGGRHRSLGWEFGIQWVNFWPFFCACLCFDPFYIMIESLFCAVFGWWWCGWWRFGCFDKIWERVGVLTHTTFLLLHCSGILTPHSTIHLSIYPSIHLSIYPSIF